MALRMQSDDGQNGSGSDRSVRMWICTWLIPFHPVASMRSRVLSRNLSARAMDFGELSFGHVPSHTMPNPPGTTFCHRATSSNLGDV